jgi:hypothetical protein
MPVLDRSQLGITRCNGDSSNGGRNRSCGSPLDEEAVRADEGGPRDERIDASQYFD